MLNITKLKIKNRTSNGGSENVKQTWFTRWNIRKTSFEFIDRGKSDPGIGRKLTF